MKAAKAKSHGRNRFMRLITLPIRALGRARDFYVRSMNNAERLGYGSAMGGGPSGLPKSFSVRPARSGDGAADDYAELVRAASARSYGGRIDVDAILGQRQQPSEPGPKTTVATTAVVGVGAKGLPKCGSVGMGKIDEDKTCDFGEDGGNCRTSDLFTRSRSYALAKRRVVL